MSVIAIASLHGSPGATTLAVGLAAATPGAVLVEADASGGVIAARCGLAREPGLVTFAADRGAFGLDGLHRHAQLTESGLAVLPCPESAEHTSGILRSAGNDLAVRLAEAGSVFVDLGRLGPEPAGVEVLDFASALVVVVRPTIDGLAVLAARLPNLTHRRLIVALVGDRPYGPADVVGELGVDVAAVIPFDPRATDELWLGGHRRRGLARSAWARSVQALANDLDVTGSREVTSR